MSNPPPIPPAPPNPPGPVLNYQPPQPGPGRNRWWMIGLRIFGGIFAALVSGGAGVWLAQLTNSGVVFLIPPSIVFAGLLIVCIKYRRFGYVTGFIIAPFLVVTALVITLAIICGSSLTGHP